MYGIVNKAIKGLIVSEFGIEKWAQVQELSGVHVDIFLSNEPYDDEVTFKLAQGAADVLGITLTDVLIAFGEYWILHTGKKEYGSLMEAGGDNLREFLINLPNFHSRIMLMFPKLIPPEFRISDIKENSLYVHYYSDREGLLGFVIGLLQGLGKMFDTKAEVTHLEGLSAETDHEIFSVQWEA